MQADIEEIVKVSLRKAIDHDLRGNIGQAYAHYTAVLEFCPAKRPELEKRFTNVLCEWGLYLEQINRMDDVMKCYLNSLEMFPTNPKMLNNFAAHLLKIYEPMEAIKYLERALGADNNFLPAERNMQNAYSMAVDRWHFSMLNDKSRNQAFAQAIKKRISLGYDTILDIGTGTGLLSLYAKDAGAKKVYACDHSRVMCNIAEQVFKKNNAEDVELICKSSTDLKIPDDIPERVKLIVTEIFDAALFGELVIPTLIDAHKNLLATDGTGIIIPMRATLYIAAVESEYIRFRSSVSFYESQHLGSLNFGNIFILPDEFYYDCENLENVKINYITEPMPLLKLDFNDINELEKFSNDGIKEVISASCRYDGIVDGLVAWFQLNLDEEITLDSSQGKSCWQLAVFPSFPQNVRASDKLVITSKIFNGRLKCTYQKGHEDTNMHSKLIYQLPRNIITFLNDKDYTTSLTEVAKSKKEEKIMTVFDTSPFPVYGLTVLKENNNCEILYYQTDNEALKHFIEHIVNKNEIKGKVFFVTDFIEIVCTLDSIFIHNFDTKGELIDWGLESHQEIYSCLLSSTGQLLPEKVFLMGQLVYSADLPKMVSVKDDNLQGCMESLILNIEKNSAENNSDSGDDDVEENCQIGKTEDSNKNIYKFKIAENINQFQINQVFDLNPSLYNCTALSDVKTLIEMDESEMKEKIINFGAFDNEKNELIPNALICWYKICITNEKEYETRKNNCFMNHMAIVFEKELQEKVLRQENINIKIQQIRNIVRISVT